MSKCLHWTAEIKRETEETGHLTSQGWAERRWRTQTLILAVPNSVQTRLSFYSQFDRREALGMCG